MEIKNISFMLVAVGMFFAACSDNDNVTVSTYSGEVPIFTLSPSFSLYTESENTYMVLSEDGAYAGLSVDLSVNGEIYHLFGTRDIAVKPLLEGGLLSDRWPCRYSFLTQSSDWIECDYDVSTWGKGNGPFGCGHDIATPWSSKNLYIRRDFEWNETDFSGNLFLDYCIKGEAEVYLNGDFLIKLKGNGKLQRIELPATTAMFMYKGTNVLAVKCINHSMSADAISDFGIVMSADEHIEDADLTGISCNADVSRLEYLFGTVKAELSFIAH